MLLLGILSIVQIIFIPGYILISHLRLKTLTTLQKLLYIFALSLFVNYTLVTVLTLLGLYKLVLYILIILLEIIYISILVKTKSHLVLFDSDIRMYLEKYISFFRQLSKSKKIILFAAKSIVIFYFSLIFSNVGSIFYFVDPAYLIHLNTWAMDFANNMLPQQSSHFPQLIPANWSIAYLLIGENNIQMFPKFIMPLFFLGNILMFVDLALTKRNVIYLIGLVIYGLFGPIIYSLVFIADGSADLPVSFFAFLTFYTYLKTDNDKFLLKDRLLFFLFASTAAATKLAGFYVFTVASLFSLYMLIRYWKSIKKHELLIVALSVAAIITISHFWYFLKPATMAAGLHQPQWVGTDYQLIFINAINLMYYNWGLPVFAFFIITIISSFFVKESRYVTLIMVIPPIIIWMFKYSDDFRNLSFVIPFLSYASAFGLMNLIERTKNRKTNTYLDFNTEGLKDFSRNFVFIGVIISVISLLLFVFINSSFFYSQIYKIYKFTSIYYFQSHRINHLIDYTPYINIDYYQRTFVVILILIPSVLLLGILKIKLKHFLIALVMMAVILNFTLIDKASILSQQVRAFELVDARNYGLTINTIVNSAELDNTIYTNFKTIADDNKTEKLNFIYKSGNEITKIINENHTNYLFFLKLDLLSLETARLINELKASSKLNILFDDRKFVLFNYGDYEI